MTNIVHTYPISNVLTTKRDFVAAKKSQQVGVIGRRGVNAPKLAEVAPNTPLGNAKSRLVIPMARPVLVTGKIRLMGKIGICF